MKKMKYTLLYICILCSFALNVQAQKQIVILHTNDSHSTILPLNPNLADTALANRGGFLRRVAMVKQERQQHPDLLLFDSGDFSQGSPYYTMFKGDVEIGLMNEMHYDAATIGNHEFDFGMANMARLFRKAKFPIVCANYDFTGTELADIVKPWVIIKRNGLKIGVFGLCPRLKGLVAEANYGTIKYLDPIEEGMKVATLLKKQKKCDIVICLSHLGWQIEDTDDTNLIPATRYIDLILGGHSHSYFQQLEYRNNLDGKPTPADQNGKHAIWVGKMVMTLK